MGHILGKCPRATRDGLPFSLWFDRTLVLEEPTEIHLAMEAGLGVGSDFGENGWVGIPHSDATVIFPPLLIVDDEGHDLVAEAFFHHD